MIINSSSVSMSSDRSYAGYASSKTESLTVRADSDAAAMITISPESQNMYEQLVNTKDNMEKERQAQLKQNLQAQMENMRQQQAEAARKAKQKNAMGMKDPTDMKLELLKRILEMLNKVNGKKKHGNETKGIEEKIEQLEQSRSSRISFGFTGVSFSLSAGSAVAAAGSGATGASNTWVTHTVTSSFLAEVENTAFSTTGIAKTADGREISFNVELEMSRSFILKNETYAQSMATLVDPLVINVGSNVTSVSDQKFLFDLDADGREEEISYLGEGTGFLALDKNGDGKINNGSELFGTKSGDGFKDLAAYDEDGNGWIDEADSIFDKLKVWIKNEDGTDTLIAIGKAGVGAIYLGSAGTEFSLKNQENGETNAVIQKTGVFLFEEGGAGTVQHVDLSI